MPKKSSLLLHEEIMLLALHDEKGTVSSGNYGYAIGGAVLAELLLTGRLGIEEERKKKWIALRSDEPLGDPILDECLAMAKASIPAPSCLCHLRMAPTFYVWSLTGRS